MAYIKILGTTTASGMQCYRNLIHCQWHCSLFILCRKQYVYFSENYPSSPITFQEHRNIKPKRYVQAYTYCSTIYNSQDL